MNRLFSISIVSLIGAFAIFVFKDQFGGELISLDPAISYQAEFSLQINNRTLDGKTQHVPGTTRSEFEFEGVTVVSLDLWDKERSYLILPELRQYTGLNQRDSKRAVAQLSSLIYKFSNQVRAVGTEQLEGLRVTKYRIADHGAKFLIWVTDKGLLVRLEGDGELNGRQLHVEYALTNIEVGPQDPLHFKLPNGYRRVPSAAHFRR
jgi:hypothetical protein